jgi:hypothetical protein
MARGWESKSIESQIEGAREKPAKPKLRLTPEQQASARESERLKLSRAYVRQQLAVASNSSRVQALQKALQEIEEKLARFERE